MAIVVERTTAKATVSGGNAVASFVGTPTIGNRIVTLGEVWKSAGSVASPVLSDQDSNVYSKHNEPTDNAVGEGRALIASAPITATRSGLQITWGLNGNDTQTMSCLEVSGLDSSPVDVAVGTGADSTSPFEQSSGALAQADELVCGAFIFIGTADQDENIALTTWGGISPTTLWTEDGPGIVAEFGAAGYKIVSSVSAVLVGFVADQNQPSAVAVVSFKGAAPAGTQNQIAWMTA